MTSFRHTPEDALRRAVDALGGPQRVGHDLKPEMPPPVAGVWLSHCLTASKRDKLSLSQIACIFRDAYKAGEHDGFMAFAESLGYRVIGIEPQAQADELTKSAEAKISQAIQELQQVRELTAEQSARAKSVHLNVE